MKVFISYRHNHSDWVSETLYPVLSAGGAEVLVDYKDFSAGVAVRKQMKDKQDLAEIHLLVLTPDYFESDYCLEEMRRAIAADPRFEVGKVLPVVLETCELPMEFKKHNPLYVNLSASNKWDMPGWERIMKAAGAQLGMPVPNWLRAFQSILKALKDRRSVNFLVKEKKIKWRELLAQLKVALPDLGIVDLESGRTATPSGLATEILKELAGYQGTLPKNNGFLAEFERVIEAQKPSRLALLHFDHVLERKYGNDLFSSLRFLTMSQRKLTLLIGSRAPFATLLPKNHTLSELDMETVELSGL